MRAKRASHDPFIVFVSIALLLIPLYFLAPGTFLFRPFAGEFSIYGTAVSLFLVLGFLGWIGFFRWWIKGEISKERFLENLGNTLAALGFRRSWAQVVIGLVVGAGLGVFTWHVFGASPSNSLGLAGWVLSTGIIMVFFAPLIEETLFRGYLINRCISSGRGRAWAWTLAVAASVLLFSYLHARNPEQKMVVGAVFTLVYLWGRGNNMTATIMVHATGNATILLSAFLPLGSVEAAVALLTVVISISLLVLIVWKVSQPLPSPISATFARRQRGIVTNPTCGARPAGMP